MPGLLVFCSKRRLLFLKPATVEQQQLSDPTAFLMSRFCQNDPSPLSKRHWCSECEEEAATGINLEKRTKMTDGEH